MSETNAVPYLAIVKDAMGANLQAGAAPEMQQMTALFSHRILARLVANAERLPGLRAEAMHRYQGLLGALKPLLEEGEGSALAADFARQLQGEGDFGAAEATLQRICARLACQSAQGGTGEAARQLLRQVVAIEHQLKSAFLAAYNEAMASGADAAAAQEVLSAPQLERLLSWLRERFPGNDDMAISGLKAIPGGFSKQTIFVFLRNAATLPATVVIRLDWTDSAVGTTVVDEFHIIQTLFAAGVKVPQPFAMEDSGAVLGGPFLLVSKAEGSNIGDALDVHGGSPAFARDLAHTLAKLHAVPAAAFGDSVAGAKESTQQRLRREIETFESGWRALGETSVALEIAFAWLKQNIQRADGARSLIHKDVGCHNMLAQDGKLTALLDWETAAIGNPAQDLGYAYPTVVQMCDWDEFIAAYAAAGGTPPAPAQIDYYTLWGYTWLNVMLLQARAAFASGGANDIRLGYAGAYLLARLQARLSDKLNSLV